MYKIEISRENANDDNVIITNIHVKNYQQVNKGDILFEFETSKTLVEIEAERDGIVSLNIEIGQTVPIGWTAAVIDNNEFHFEEIKNDKSENYNDLEKFSVKAIELIKKYKLENKTFSELDFVTAQDVEEMVKKKLFKNKEHVPDKFKEDEIALFGAGLQCQVVLDMVQTENLNLKINAIIDSEPEKDKIDNIHVYNKLSLDLLFKKGLRRIHICIGNGIVKSQIANDLKSRGFNIVSIIAPSATISKTAHLDDGVFIGSGVYIGRDVKICELSQINHLVSIAHNCVVGAGSFFADGCRVGGNVNFGEHVNLGIGVVVNRDINIGKEASVPSGAIIIKDLEAGEIYKSRKITK